jgi:hypothetical protein
MSKSNSENELRKGNPSNDAARNGPESPTSEGPPAAALPTRPRRRRWLSILLGLVIFTAGVVVGGAGALVALRHTLLYAIHHPDEFPPQAAARLRSVLDLSDEQTRQVEQVLRNRQAALQAIRREVQPRVEAELDLVDRQVGEILTPEQRASWNARFAELRGIWIPPAPGREPYE